jgi:hypothetical protein
MSKVQIETKKLHVTIKDTYLSYPRDLNLLSYCLTLLRKTYFFTIRSFFCFP